MKYRRTKNKSFIFKKVPRQIPLKIEDKNI
jgi:hypothetical protein